MSLKSITSIPPKKKEELFDMLSTNLRNTIDNIGNISDEQLEQAVTELGQLNDLAYKGYRNLRIPWEKLNDKIYSIKNVAVYILAKEFQKRGMDVSYGSKETVVYFRKRDGIQISFHVPKTSPEEIEFYSSLPSGEWDQVEKAYSFSDIQDYRLIIEQRKEAEAIAAEIADKQKDQNVERVINYLRYCSDWKLAYDYKIDPRSDMRTCVYKMEGYKVRPCIDSFRSDIVVRDALGNYEQRFADEVDSVLKEHGLPFRFDTKRHMLTQTKMGKISVEKSKKTSSRKKVA